VTLIARPDRARRSGNSVFFGVRDTGIGIPADKLGRLFKHFSQVDGSISREYGGTGLGLAITKRLVELMGGVIGVHSREGDGSLFWFTLDLPRADAALKLDGRPGTARFTPARVLLVEDIPVNQDLARAVLERAGHSVELAANGAEALQMVQSSSFDVILMDAQMPVMDGISATRRIRALPGPVASIPIIAMTANVLPEQVASFKAAGANQHVGKPFDRRDLLQKIDHLVSRTGALPVSNQTLPTAADLCPVFDSEAFGQLADVMGGNRLTRLLTDFEQQLEASFVGNREMAADPANLAAQAHTVVSAAGMLGFARLSHACRNLEQACLSGSGDVKAVLATTRSICDETLTVLRRARADLDVTTSANAA
jgi:CheY-like chemotaxis protein/HPt (histidine-containing phosphotransfer) domain-containing protein